MNSYYNERSREFFERTVSLDLSDLYKPFLELIPENGYLLDAGCGSGRDALAFKKMGYVVTAMDASEKMVEMAREHTGMQVVRMGFEEIAAEEEFDGIWACASLVHVVGKRLFSRKGHRPHPLTPPLHAAHGEGELERAAEPEGRGGVFDILIGALKVNGAMYMSFRSAAPPNPEFRNLNSELENSSGGQRERVDEHGRLFLDFTVEGLREVLEGYGGVEIVRIWESEGAVDNQIWTNGLVRRTISQGSF